MSTFRSRFRLGRGPSAGPDRRSPDVDRLLEAARAAGTPEELAREDAMVALFHRARLDPVPPSRSHVVRSPLTAIRAVVATVAAVLLMSSGIALAASGHAPWKDAAPAGAAADDESTSTDDPSETMDPSDDDTTEPADDESTDETSDPADTESTDATDTESESGDPSTNGYRGLCRAIVSGNKDTNGSALESPAFQSLITAAGGIDSVETYCATIVPPKPTHVAPTHPVAPSHPTHSAPTHTAPEHTAPTHPSHPTHSGQSGQHGHPVPPQGGKPAKS